MSNDTNKYRKFEWKHHDVLVTQYKLYNERQHNHFIILGNIMLHVSAKP